MRIGDEKITYKIYKPTKTATQSGLGNTYFWYLKAEPNPCYIEPLMGWIGSKSPQKQILLKFDSIEEAVFYAKKRNIKYVVEMPKEIRRRPKSYMVNF